MKVAKENNPNYEIQINSARDTILKLDAILKGLVVEKYKFKSEKEKKEAIKDLKNYLNYRIKEDRVNKELKDILKKLFEANITKKNIDKIEKLYYALYTLYPGIISYHKPSKKYGEAYIKGLRADVTLRKYKKSVKEGEKAFKKLSKRLK